MREVLSMAARLLSDCRPKLRTMFRIEGTLNVCALRYDSGEEELLSA